MPSRRAAAAETDAVRRAAAPAFAVPAAPMEARSEDRLPEGDGWQYEPKWDGFRCIAARADGRAEMYGKSGKPLARYFPDVATHLESLALDGCMLDGELVIPVGDMLSFEELQMRLHPAESRVRKLAAAHPARFVLFDCLAAPGQPDLAEAPLSERRAALEQVLNRMGHDRVLRLSPFTLDRAEAQGWLDRSGGALDGVVAKRRDGPYRFGERAMVKVKLARTADCVVGGFRYETGGRNVGSLLLGLYDEQGLLHHVGFTSGIAAAERPALTKRLEALVEAPGFTGRTPGRPSRWSTERSADWQPLRPELVVEVRYDQVTAGRFRHGTSILRWRPDKAPRQCTLDQLGREARPGLLVDAVLRNSEDHGREAGHGQGE